MLIPDEGYSFKCSSDDFGNKFYTGTLLPSDYLIPDLAFLPDGTLMVEYRFTATTPSGGNETIGIEKLDLEGFVPTETNASDFIDKTISESPLGGLENIEGFSDVRILCTEYDYDGNYDGNNVMNAESTFRRGYSYMIDLYFICDEGHSFMSTDNSYFTGDINPYPKNCNELATSINDNYELINSSEQLNVLHIDYFLDLSNFYSDINEINLSSYISTTDLQELDDEDVTLQSFYNSLENIEVPNTSLRKISIVEHYLDDYMHDQVNDVNIDSTFNINKQYLVNLYFKANSGYKFPSQFSVSTGFQEFSGMISPTPTSSITGKFVGESSDCDISTTISDEGFVNTGLCITYDLKCDWEKLNDAIVNRGSKSIDGLFDVTYDEQNDVKTIKLLKDFTAQSNSRALETSGANLVLDLNGHVLNRNLISPNGTITKDPKGYGSVIYLVNGGNLTIKDSNPTAKHIGYVDSNGLWHLSASGHPTTGEFSKTIYGGVLTGGTGNKFSNSAYYEGGGVYILNQSNYGYNSSVTLNGGNICGNYVSNYGAGIASIEEDGYGESSQLTLTINGTNIINNYSCNESKSNDLYGGGAGLYTFGGKVYINNAHIDDNVTDYYGGGVFNSDYSEIYISSGSINNNIARNSGGIYSRNGYGKVSLDGNNDAGVTITGNKSEFDGNVICKDLSVSGKVIIKDNISEPVLMYEDGYPVNYDSSGNPITNFDGSIKKIVKANANDLVFEYNSDNHVLDSVLEVNDVLNDSNINLSILYFILQNSEEISEEMPSIMPVVTSNYLNAYADAQSKANAKANDFIHYSGSDIYYLKLIENELCVVDTPIESATSSNDVTEAISQAADMFDENPESNFKIKISKPSGTEEETEPIVLEEISLPSNTTLDLDGNDVEFKGETIIFGELEDSGETKGKIFMDKPENLIYNSSKEAETEDEMRQMPTWWPDVDGDGGYYYLYELGAQSKWSPVDGVKWQKPGDNVAKFKIQPTIKEIESLQDVYVSGTKLKVGVRVSLVHNNGSDRIIDLTFGNDLIENWSSSENPAKKCVYVQLEGLKNYKSLGADAALYSKPSNKTNLKNSEFHTLYMDASN